MRKWKQILPVAAAAMLAAYFGARLAASQPAGLALGATAGARNSDGRIVIACTGANQSGGRNANRLVVVDTVSKKILVYRIYSQFTRLIAVRSYKFDLEWGVTPDVLRGSGFTYKQAEAAAKQVRAARARAGENWRLRGREMVITGDAPVRGSQNRIVLLNADLKTFLVYRLDGNSIWLSSARRYDRDQMLLYTEPLRGQGFTYDQVKKMVDDAEKANVAGRRLGR
jgi:hypothetical protein